MNPRFDFKKRNTPWQEIDVFTFDDAAKHVTILVLNDKHKKANALTLRCLRELRDAIVAHAAGPLLIAADGTSFCAGLDHFELVEEISRRGSCEEHLNALTELYRVLALKDDTASLLQGHAVGGGVGLALVCKVVVAMPGVELRIPGGAYAALAAVFLPILGMRRSVGAAELSALIGRNIPLGQAFDDGLIDKAVLRVPEDVADRDLLIGEALKGIRQTRDAPRRQGDPFIPLVAQAVADAKAYALKSDVTRAIFLGLFTDLVGGLEKKLRSLRPTKS